jgi:beta-glucanase (GH16 family)
MHPTIAQPGSRPAAAGAAKSAMTAVFKPVRKGRPVVLQRQRGTGWTTVAKAKEDGHGVAEFTAPYAVGGEVATYRAVASRASGVPQVASAGVRTDVLGAPDFSDEFSGTTLGAAWSNRLQGYSAASKRKCSKASPDAVRVGGGTVQISVLKDRSRAVKCRYDGQKYSYRLNGSIGTAGTQSFTYGYAAARIKFQPRAGQHASFWLQPQTSTAAEGSAKDTGAEIDAIEWFGNDQPKGGLTSFVYHYPNNGKPGVTPKKVGGYISNPSRYGSGWASRYHVFSVEWTPRAYVFRIDGKQSYRITQGISGQPEFLILSLLSSDYELKHLGSERNLPQHMNVDWVRYWAQ